MLADITTALSQVITWLGTVVSAFFGENGALAPLTPVIIIAVAISLVLLGIKVIRKSMWGA